MNNSVGTWNMYPCYMVHSAKFGHLISQRAWISLSLGFTFLSTLTARTLMFSEQPFERDSYVCAYSCKVTQPRVNLNWKERGRKRSWPSYRYYPSICMMWLKKSVESLSNYNDVPAEIPHGPLSNTRQNTNPTAWTNLLSLSNLIRTFQTLHAYCIYNSISTSCNHSPLTSVSTFISDHRHWVSFLP
jgi:hypothetical protein